MLSHAFAGAHDPKAGRLVESNAGDILGEDAGLDRPDAGPFGGVNELFEKCPTDSSSMCGRRDVDGIVDDTGVGAAVADRHSGDPPHDIARSGDGDEAMCREVVAVPGRPIRGSGLERRITSVEPLLMDPQHRPRVLPGHVHDEGACAPRLVRRHLVAAPSWVGGRNREFAMRRISSGPGPGRRTGR